jgi:hypothetical protein
MNATVAKKIKIRKPAAHELKGYGDEPKWPQDVMAMPLNEYITQTMRAVNWYYQFFTKRDSQEWVGAWYAEHFPKRRADLKYIAAAKPDTFMNITLYMYAMEQHGWVARMPVLRHVVKNLKDIIADGKARKAESDASAKTAENAPYVPTIQDRMREAAGDMCEELDAAIDSYILDAETFDPKAFKIASLLRGKGAKPAHARLIKNFYAGPLAEYQELFSDNCDEQLTEGHSCYTKKQQKKMADFLVSIVDACDQIAAEAKTLKKPRAKKAKPAEDVVKKLKYKLTDDKYAIASIPATQIVGSQTLVVFNAKTRKVGVYYADGPAGLTVRGTSIIGYNEAKSQQKTMRKPDVQVKELKDLNTARRAENWFDTIKTTGTPLNGRVNAEVMILKAWK